ncbi:MAG: hypothetical protein KGN02_02815 [bacterium]|nr:hypothetical protein [bacterium]
MRTMLRLRAIIPLLALALMVVTSATGLACDKSFVLINRSNKTIVAFFASPHASNRWEDNILGSDSLEPGLRDGIDMKSDQRHYSLYDIKAVFADGTKVEGARFNLCRVAYIGVYNHKVMYRNGH